MTDVCLFLSTSLIVYHVFSNYLVFPLIFQIALSIFNCAIQLVPIFFKLIRLLLSGLSQYCVLQKKEVFVCIHFSIPLEIHDIQCIRFCFHEIDFKGACLLRAVVLNLFAEGAKSRLTTLLWSRTKEILT